MNDPILHSHSGIERDLCMSKHWVLVDAKFSPMFSLQDLGHVFTRRGVKYVEVRTLAFVKKNGTFKNYSE